MAQTVTTIGSSTGSSTELYIGSGADNDDTVIETGDVTDVEVFKLTSTAGAVDVVVSLDGSTYSTAPHSLVDLGAELTTPVLVTVAARSYEFYGPGYKKVKVLQNGATAATAHLSCARKVT